MKFALVEPPGTSTLDGTDATVGLLLESPIEMPPLGAAFASESVPWDGVPDETAVGFSAIASPGWMVMKVTFEVDSPAPSLA